MLHERARTTFVAVVTSIVLLLSLTGVAFAQDGHDIHWGYEGESGPEHWGDLSPDYATCADGMEQSPIDIASTTESNPADLEFSYQPSALTIVNNGHTIQANYDEGSSLGVDGESYALLQFHFHSPSEHTVDDGAAPMELHMVHQNADGDLAVVGILLVEGAENEALAPVFDNLPATEGEPEAIDGVTVDASALLPSDATYWRYNGSLTTPPCSEGVKWFVMTQPVEVSAEQIAAYTALYSGNARPTQAMNDREFIVGQMTPPTMPETGAATNLPMVGIVVFGAVIALAGVETLRRRNGADR